MRARVKEFEICWRHCPFFWRRRKTAVPASIFGLLWRVCRSSCAVAVVAGSRQIQSQVAVFCYPLSCEHLRRNTQRVNVGLHYAGWAKPRLGGKCCKHWVGGVTALVSQAEDDYLAYLLTPRCMNNLILALDEGLGNMGTVRGEKGGLGGGGKRVG